MVEREFSQEERERLAAEGKALPDGSYPIPDCDALHRAIQSYGRAPDEHRPALRRLIVRRKAAMGCSGVDIPENWRMVRASA